MKFKQQVNAAVSKANQKLGMIKRNFATMTPKMFIVLYPMLVRPHLEYAVQIWSPYQQGLQNKLEAVQRRATKLVKGMKNLSYSDRLQSLNLMSTEVRRNRGDMILAYRIMSKKLDLGREIFSTPIGNSTRGHTAKLQKVRFKKDKRKYFFTNRVVNHWNGLPQRAIDLETVDAFKKGYNRIENRGSTTR